MNRHLIITLFLLLSVSKFIYAQDIIAGQGYVLTGLQRRDNGELENFYRLVYPKNADEMNFFDSVYKQALALKNYHFLVGQFKTNILSLIDKSESYNFLVGKGLSKTDSFIIQNSISYDVGNCAQMRISRPFSANITLDSFEKSGYVIHIDKVEFDGYLVNITSGLYTKLMSYRSEDRNNKLLSFIEGKHIIAKLSTKTSLDNLPIVFVPRHIKIFDKNYHVIEPDCFMNKDY